MDELGNEEEGVREFRRVQEGDTAKIVHLLDLRGRLFDNVILALAMMISVHK